MKGYEVEYRFPRVGIEVLGGVAYVEGHPPGVDVVIVDYDNAEDNDGEPTEDLYCTLEADTEYMVLDYRGGEMLAFVPRDLAATENAAIDLVKSGHQRVIVVPQAWYTHGDLWGEVEI